MLLSTQLFDRIVGISTSRAPDRKGTVLPAGCRKAPERRQAARIAFGQRTLICRDDGPKTGVWDTVMLQDISQGGVGFMCHQPMPTGVTFVLKLTDSDDENIRIRCLIQRCERGGFGGTAYLIGAEFKELIVHQAIRVTNEDGEETHTVQSVPDLAESPTAGSVRPTGLRHAIATVARLAINLLRAVDPSQWMRKADDFSSVS